MDLTQRWIIQSDEQDMGLLILMSNPDDYLYIFFAYHPLESSELWYWLATRILSYIWIFFWVVLAVFEL